MKKRVFSVLLSVVMVLSLLPVTAAAAEEGAEAPLWISVGETPLVEDGSVPEGRELPRGMAFTYDGQEGRYVLTMEDVSLTQTLSVHSEDAAIRLDIVLKGENIIDLRGSGGCGVAFFQTESRIVSGEESASLSIYTKDDAAVGSWESALTIDGAALNIESRQVERTESAVGFQGNSDLIICGGAEVNAWGQYMGFIMNGNVTFEDCTVTTNRIHVHSSVDEKEDGTAIVDQKTMTVGEGAVVNVVSDEVEPLDSCIMLLDGSILKIDGGILNCDQSARGSGTIMVGFNEDRWINTLLLEDGELNVFRNGGDEWSDAIGVYRGRFIQNGGRLNVSGAARGLSLGYGGSAQFNGGSAEFRDNFIAILTHDLPAAEGEDKVSFAGTELHMDSGYVGLVVSEGRASISGGQVTSVVESTEWNDAMGLSVSGELIMSGGGLTVDSGDLGVYVDEPGTFVFQGGSALLESQKRSCLVGYGLTELRGGELILRSGDHAFVGVLGTGDPLYLGENMFVRTPDAVQKDLYEAWQDVWYTSYVDEDGTPCRELSFGSTGGVFAGRAEVSGTELSVGVPFVVSADLALGESAGTAVFSLPEGLTVKGTASVNGKAVNSRYDESENTLTVPVDTPSAAVRFYVHPAVVMEEEVIECAVTVGEKTHVRTTSAFTVKGLQVTLPVSVSQPVITLSGMGAPGGEVKVFEVSDDTNPVLLTEQAIRVDLLGNFSGTVSLPALPAGHTTGAYRLEVVLYCDDNGDGTVDYRDIVEIVSGTVSYVSHAARLENLSIRNRYHGMQVDDILENDISIQYGGGVSINGSKDTKAYNYFPEYPAFTFEAAFSETDHILSAWVEARSDRGQCVSVPLEYDSGTGLFVGQRDFPDWAPEAVAVYWVEEGVVNRESVYQTAIARLEAYEGSGGSYDAIVEETAAEVTNAMEEYFAQVTKKKLDENTYAYYDADGERIFTTETSESAYEEGMELTGDFEDVGGAGRIYAKTELLPEALSGDSALAFSSTVVVKVPTYERVYQKVIYVDTWTVDVTAPPVTGGVTGATPGQRAAVFILKQVPRVGDAVQAVDSRLLHDSLVDFDTTFADDIEKATRTIMQTENYRCPYTGQEIPRSNNAAAIKALQALLDLQTEYAREYQENKDAIREDMKESLLNGVTLGVNKFGNKKVRKAWEVYQEIQGEWDGYQEDMENLRQWMENPEGKMQSELDEMMTPQGWLQAAKDQGIVDEDTADLIETLMDPDKTYKDTHDFMIKYRDKLTEIMDAYTLALQKDLEIQGGMADDCAPPPDDPAPPELPNTAGGEEIPIPAIEDPSGYVYEGVESNRLEDVTVTLYYGGEGETPPAQNAGELGLLPWDAGVYGQANPLITDALGQYQWMVPDGWWQVRYEKEGYETTYSDWLPVPPPQTEVNVGMVRLGQTQADVECGEGEMILTFDRYVKAESVLVELIEAGEIAARSVLALDASIAPDGETRLATRFKVSYDASALANETTAKLSVIQTENYAGVSLAEPLVKDVTLIPYHWGVHVEGSFAEVSGEGRYQPGTVVQLDAGQRQGYTFAGWTSQDVEITGAEGGKASFVMPDWDVQVRANWEKNPGAAVGGRVKSENPNREASAALRQEGEVKYEAAVSGGEPGAFRFDEVAVGVYDLVISKEGHLSFVITGLAVGEGEIDLSESVHGAISTITLVCGDVDGSGAVNSDDLNQVWSGNNYLKSAGDDGVDEAADVNGDGKINSDDLNLIWKTENYLKTEADCIVSYGGSAPETV